MIHWKFFSVLSFGLIILIISQNSLLAQSNNSCKMSEGFLVGKLALVTGGSGTIGKAIAKSLLLSGASVVLTARRLEKLEKTKAELLESVKEEGKNTCPEIHVLSSDVSKEESVVELFQKIDDLTKDGSGIDLLVNNAGTLLLYFQRAKSTHPNSEIF